MVVGVFWGNWRIFNFHFLSESIFSSFHFLKKMEKVSLFDAHINTDFSLFTDVKSKCANKLDGRVGLKSVRRL